MSKSSPIFRDEAIKHYKKSKDKATLPRFMPFPVTFLLWFLLAFLLVVVGLAWNEEIPLYETAPGVVLDQPGKVLTNSHETTVAIFIPMNQIAKIHVGQVARVQISGSKEQFTSKIIKVESTALSPSQIHQRYGFEADIVTQPSIVALIQTENLPTASYAGSVLMVNVKTGSQRIISLLPGIGNLVGG